MFDSWLVVVITDTLHLHFFLRRKSSHIFCMFFQLGSFPLASTSFWTTSGTTSSSPTTRLPSTASSLSSLSGMYYIHSLKEGTLNLSGFNVNVMTGNNEAYQHSPYDPVIRKWPFFLSRPQNFFFISMKLSFASYITSSIKVKQILGSGQKRKVISESLGHKENVGVLRCFRSWHWH